jgi:hypothetical protein
MSAIHDALRRAAEADRRRGGPGPRLVPLQGVPVSRPSRPVAPWLGWSLLVSVLGAAAWWVWTSASLAPAPTLATAAGVESMGPGIGEVAASFPVPPEVASRTAAAVIQVSTNLVVREPPPAALSATHTEVPIASESPDPSPWIEEVPVWRLQSIILRTGHPLAMINGQTVHVGDEVDGGRVLEIGPQAVVVEWGGERHRLEPAEQRILWNP